jgi:hypothetical protein
VVARPIPENVEVVLRSKTDEYTALVRVDLCAPAEKRLPAEPEEGSVVMVNDVAHQRLGDGHWYSAGEVGRADGLAWWELHMLGDVEVIHHA